MSAKKKKVSPPASEGDSFVGFTMPGSNYADFGRHPFLIRRGMVSEEIRAIATKVGSFGASDLIKTAGFGFLEKRQSPSGKHSMMEAMTQAVAADASSTDLGWITSSYPRVLTLADWNHPDVSKRTPVAVPPVFVMYDLGDHYATAMCLLTFDGVDPSDLPGLSVRGRLLTWIVNAIVNGDPAPFRPSQLKPKLLLGKVAFHAKPSGEPAAPSVKLTDFLMPASEEASLLSQVPQSTLSFVGRLGPRPAPESYDLHTLAGWRSLLSEETFDDFAVISTLFASDRSVTPVTAEVVEATIAQTQAQLPLVFSVAAEVFASPHKEVFQAADPVLAARLLYKLGRYTSSTGKSLAAPVSHFVTNELRDGNIVVP